MRAILHEPNSACWYEYLDLVSVMQCTELANVMETLAAAERWAMDERGYAAGWVAYEAATAIDGALEACVDVRPAHRAPLVCFGLFQSRRPFEFPAAEPVAVAVPWTLNIRRSQYNATLKQIDQHIRAGDFYQVNFSARCSADLDECERLFHAIARDALYGAYLECDDYAVISASPELFFALRNGELMSRPMKGTASRSPDPVQDEALREWLEHSEKNRAENLMITDMVRNDMGRVARAGSVTVEQPFAIEAHPTVWQMTSTVKAATSASVTEVFAALFPAASITGAPKCASMKFIAAHETTPRGIYTGAIGVIGPGCQAQFSVAIRSVGVDLNAHQAVFGVGGGIVADSVLDEEYAELISKTRVLAPAAPLFELLETMRLEDGLVFLLSRHLERAQSAAKRFGFGFDRSRIEEEVLTVCADYPEGRFRVRLTIDRLGGCAVTATPLSTSNVPQRIKLAVRPVSVTEMLNYKTTDRSVYDTAAAEHPDCEIILHTNTGYVTESTIANIVYEMEGVQYTPPVSDGLLPGILRSQWVEDGRIAERSLHMDEVSRVERWFLLNTLRGCREAVLVTD